jgi:hypothetical protein
MTRTFKWRIFGEEKPELGKSVMVAFKTEFLRRADSRKYVAMGFRYGRYVWECGEDESSIRDDDMWAYWDEVKP